MQTFIRCDHAYISKRVDSKEISPNERSLSPYDTFLLPTAHLEISAELCLCQFSLRYSLALYRRLNWRAKYQNGLDIFFNHKLGTHYYDLLVL